MALDERERLELRHALVDALGPDNGNRLMDQVPPFDWAEVAMKSDLRALEERLDLKIEAKLGKLYWAMLGMMLSMTAVTAAVVGVVVSVVV